MRSEGPSPNFVFFDLSKLDGPSASAFLADLSTRFPNTPTQRCHWIVAPLRTLDLVNQKGPGPEFLQRRLASGDRLFCTNPTGIDWNHLFPSEAEAESRALEPLHRSQAFLFLESTPEPPDWLSHFERPVFRASPQGLCVLSEGKTVYVPWASDRRAGVWWIVPGQGLLGSFPSGPWADLPAALPDLSLKSRYAGPESVPPLPPSPLQKKALHDVGLLRKAQPGAPLHQAVLFRSQDYPGLGTKDAVDSEESLGGIRKRSLVANMQGQTDLAEAGLKVRFQGGRLVRIDDASGVTLCSGTESSMDWGGSRHPFVVNSAFSFEGDYSWGLRQSLLLQHDDLAEPGRAILDFYFVEESREFFVALTVRWPRWKSEVTITRWAPLELALFDLTWLEPLATRTLWPDGRAADALHRTAASGALSGTDFVFSGGKKALVLGFPQNQVPRPHRLPWRLVRGWGRSRVYVNPEGGYHPRSSKEFDGIEEHFSFYLTPATGAKLPFAVTRKQAIELIPPYVTDSPS